MTSATRRGHTLAETMLVLALSAVGLTLALPQLVAPLRRARVDATADALRAALQLARTAALARGSPVRVCASADGRRCAGGWEQGWIVLPQPPSPALLVQRAPERVTLRATHALVDGVRFTAEGWARLDDGMLQFGHFTVCDGADGRTVVLAPGGRVRVQPWRCA